MEIPKLVVKIETQQQEELCQLEIPANMAGRFVAFIGQQLDSLVMQATTAAPPPLASKTKE